MDLALSAGQRRTVEEAGAWLLELLPSDYAARAAEYRADLAFRSRYQRAAYDAGWLAPGAVAELGGRGLDPVTELLVKMELARRNAPKLPNVQGPGVVAPALLEFGTPAQREHAVPVLRGDE